MTSTKAVGLTVVALGVAASLSLAQEPRVLSRTDSPISDEMIGRRYGTMTLKKAATDPKYGFSERQPVVVSGGFGEGGHNVYRFLNTLRGLKGETVHYRRIGTCCEFNTKNSPFGDGKGLLEAYEVTVEGGTPKKMYFNWYDSGEILIPMGFTAAE
jgi:hypothetical protein